MVVSVLEEMRIRSLGVIEDAVVELSPGFTAVTGETGAGKTMVVTSLGLLLGGRADPGLVRIGTKSASVEGRITLPPGSSAAVRAEEAGAELDDGALLISRTVSAEGRSRAFVGGRAVPIGLLTELADELVAVHGQTDQQGLLRPARQREALDRYAGDAVAVPLAKYGAAYRRLREITTELDELTTRARERAQEADLLRFGLDEVAAAEPVAGEDTELAQEAERLGHAEALASAAALAHAALAGNPEDPESVDAAALVAGAQRALDAVRSHDPALAALAGRIGEIGILLGDVAGELAGYADDLDADPRRLAAVEERRSVLAHLTRKYGTDIDAVLAWAEESAARLGELEGGAHRRARRAARGAGRPRAGADRRPYGGGRALRRGGDRRTGRARHAACARRRRHPADGGRRRGRGRRAAGRRRSLRRGRGRAAAGPASGCAGPSHRQGRLGR
jgi:DNA repair protein RecN (Recombination protein N)